jgi:hypothetical protein
MFFVAGCTRVHTTSIKQTSIKQRTGRLNRPVRTFSWLWIFVYIRTLPSVSMKLDFAK